MKDIVSIWISRIEDEYWKRYACAMFRISKSQFKKTGFLKTESVLDVEHDFWKWYELSLKKCSSQKLFHFESRKFKHKFQFNWSYRTHVMVWLVEWTLFWTDFVEAVILCEKVIILEKCSKWKVLRTDRGSYWF